MLNICNKFKLADANAGTSASSYPLAVIMKILALILCSLLAIPNMGSAQKNNKYVIPGFIQINDTLFVSRSEVTIEEYAQLLAYLKKEDSLGFLRALPGVLPINWTISSSTSLHKIYEVTSSGINYPTWIRFSPIVNLSKEQAVQYCNQLTIAFNKYTPNAPKKLKKRRPSNLVFRLPTLEEWSFIATGGYDTTINDLGLNPDQRDNRVPISKDFKKIWPGERQPLYSEGGWNIGIRNKFGVFNMPGNVWEMVIDQDVVVGGSFDDPVSECNYKSVKPFSGPADNIGFRMVAIVKSP